MGTEILVVSIIVLVIGTVLAVKYLLKQKQEMDFILKDYKKRPPRILQHSTKSASAKEQN